MGRPPTDRALLLLCAACPETPKDALAALPIGQRDDRLLTLREWTFGPSLSSLTNCPACGEAVELNFAISDVRVPATPTAEDALTVESDGYEVTFQLPSSADLASLHGVEDKYSQLLQRCVRGARRGDEKRTVHELPARVLDDVVRRMAEVDPQADVHAALECPGCEHRWQAVFDIVSFFWDEIESWAHRTLNDVHALASAYGWHESEVLALSPWRRQYYLQLARP